MCQPTKPNLLITPSDVEIFDRGNGVATTPYIGKWNCADNKITYFDLGAGYSFYKTLFCKEYENVFDTIIGTTMVGRATALALRFARNAKRQLKANPALWSRFMSLRQMVKP